MSIPFNELEIEKPKRDRNGSKEQQTMGKLLAGVRLKLNMRNFEMSKALSDESGDFISRSRISDAEQGRVNLGKRLVEYYLQYLSNHHPDICSELVDSEDFQKCYDALPMHTIVHHKNNAGNSHGDLNPAIARVARKPTTNTAMYLEQSQEASVPSLPPSIIIRSDRVTIEITL